MLEEEVARLREENRALVNSILGLAGIPPMPRRNAAARPRAELAGRGFSHAERRPARPGVSTPEAISPLAAADERAIPLRRRSWQQLGRVREIEDARAARREHETDLETFPAPRTIVPRI